MFNSYPLSFNRKAWENERDLGKESCIVCKDDFPLGGNRNNLDEQFEIPLQAIQQRVPQGPLSSL